MEMRQAAWNAFHESLKHADPDRKTTLTYCASVHAFNISGAISSFFGGKKDSECYRSKEVRDFTWRFAKNLFK